MPLSEFICMGMRSLLFCGVTHCSWQLVTDVLEHPISHIFKGQAAEE